MSPGVTAPAGTPGVMDVPQILLPLSQAPMWGPGLGCGSELLVGVGGWVEVRPRDECINN